MIDTTTHIQRPARRRLGRRIGALAAALVAVGASPAAAQYGTGTPLPPLPALPGATSTGTPGTSAAPSNTPAPPVTTPASGVAGAVGSGDARPADDTSGAVLNTGVGAPAVEVVSDERAAPVVDDDNLPFTGADLGIFAAIGAALVALGLGLRRRSGLAAKS
jgi:hypothetical protein